MTSQPSNTDLGPNPFAGYTSQQLQIAEALQPHAFAQINRIYHEAKRFAYYTTADTACKILANNEIWLRKSALMNDYREIEHGFEVLNRAFDKNKERAMNILNSLFSGLFEKLVHGFNAWFPLIRSETFIACLSEHNPSNAWLDEDRNGRLSMWRAYGRNAGIAFVMKNGPFIRPSQALNAYSSPVAYLNEAGFELKFASWLDGLERNSATLRQLNEDALTYELQKALVYATICTKHPGLSEEHEWRIIQTPIFGKSGRLKRSVETIGGVPQLVLKLPLLDIPSEGLFGVTVPDLIERVIIGPTQSPLEIKAALVELLSAQNMQNAESKVVISDIPVR